jgi:hypothetical protein
LIDPSIFTDGEFWDRIKRLQLVIDEEDGTRLPGSNLTIPDKVEIDSLTWARVLELS